MIIMGGAPGRVIAIRDRAAAGTVKLFNMRPALGFDTQRVLITQVGVSRSGNYQFLHTLGNIVYIYVFGDRVGMVTVRGLALCGPISNGLTCSYGLTSGFDNLLNYYQNNRLANRRGSREVEVVISRTPIRGFLTDIQATLINPEFQVAEFTLVIRTLPEVVK